MVQAYRQHVRENLLLAHGHAAHPQVPLVPHRPRRAHRYHHGDRRDFHHRRPRQTTGGRGGAVRHPHPVGLQAPDGRSPRPVARRAPAQAAQLRRRHGNQGAAALRQHRLRGALPRNGRIRPAPRHRALQGPGHAGRPVRRRHRGPLAPHQCHPRRGPLHHRNRRPPPPRRRRHRLRRARALLPPRRPHRQDHSGGRPQPGNRRHPHQIQILPGRRSKRQSHPHSLPLLPEGLPRGQGQLHLRARRARQNGRRPRTK